jgi:hypothetical protein
MRGVRRFAAYVSVEAHRTVAQAKAGNPEALRKILGDLAAFLRGEREIDAALGYYCADSLESFLSKRAVWEAAARGYQKIKRSEISTRDRAPYGGPRLPERTLRRLGAAFCRAFGLSKPQGRGPEYEYLLTPSIIWKAFYLRLYGASLERALEIVLSVPGHGLSERQIRTSEPGSYGFRSGEHERRLELGKQVLARTERGMRQAEAYRQVARIAVTELCSLPTATVHLRSETVARAHQYATSCGDPRWDRAVRLIRRFARKHKQAERAPAAS